MKNILSFTLGVTVGVLATWMYHKNKYEYLVQEEVESLREHSKHKKTNQDSSVKDIIKDDEVVKTAKKIINYNKYSNDSSSDTISDAIDDVERDKNEQPFIITPNEFATIDDFDNDTFYYYNDDIIANSDREVINDVEELFGMNVQEIKEQFGVYEDYAVYIRNQKLECDYEILLEDDYYFKKD